MTASSGLLPALLAVQSEAPTLKKDATNPHYHSKYTPLDTIVETIGPLLAKHGLVWTTCPTTNEHGQPALRYQLIHAETEQDITGTMPLLLTKADSQGLGSAITYARRYALCSVLNLVADDDDDGHQASNGPAGRVSSTAPASDKQLDYLKSLLKREKPPEKTLRVMLEAVDAHGVDPTQQGWSQALKRDQVSRLIEVLKSGTLPTGESDIPSGDYVDAAVSVQPGDDLPFEV